LGWSTAVLGAILTWIVLAIICHLEQWRALSTSYGTGGEWRWPHHHQQTCEPKTPIEPHACLLTSNYYADGTRPCTMDLF
jgi:hypothetical protein